MTERERMIEAAVAWAERGFHVFPLSYGQKAPPPQKWPEVASNDPEFVRSWLEGYDGTVNIAIVPGKSGHAVLDVDGRAGAVAFDRLFDGRRPRTLAWKTGREGGGVHFLFRLPPGKVLASRRIADDLDVKSRKGYVLVPPSKHPSGALYEWVGSPDMEPYELSADEFAAIESMAGPGRTERDAPRQESLKAPSLDMLRKTVEKIPNDDTWDRDAYIRMGAAIKAAGADDEAEAFDIWREWAKRWTEGDNPDPTLERDWKGLHPPHSIGWEWIWSVAREHLWPDAEEAFREEFAQEPLEVLRQMGYRTGRDIMDDEDLSANRVEVIPYLAWEGKITHFWGGEKLGKSTTCRAMMKRNLEEGQRILWLDWEEGEENTKQALYDIRSMYPVSSSILFKYKPKDRKEIHKAIELFDPTVIIVDSLTTGAKDLFGGLPDTNKTEEWGMLVESFRDFAKEGRAIVLIGHAIREGSRYIGSAGKGLGCDMNVGLLEAPGDNRRLEFDGRWHVEPVTLVKREYADPETGRPQIEIEPMSASEAAAQVDQQVIEAVTQQPGLSVNALQEVVGMRRSDLLDRVNQLVDRGVLDRRVDGLYIAVPSDDFETFLDEGE